MEISPNRSQERSQSRENREGRGSPPPLNRPLSLPLDPKVGTDDGSTSPSKSSSLQRYTDLEGIKEKAERWREGRQSDGEPTDESSPEVRRREDRKDDFQ